jgi:hypothetical protein
MDRYQILTSRNKTKPMAYSFKKTSSPVRVCDYMKKCIEDKVGFSANNIYPSVIDSALSLLVKEIKIPVITKNEKSMRALNMIGVRKVYTPILASQEGVERAICYWDQDPQFIISDIDIALVIYKNRDGDF